MACIIQGHIEPVRLQSLISQLLLPFRIKVIEDVSELLVLDASDFDDFITVDYSFNSKMSWTVLQLIKGNHPVVFELEEYLACQLNKKYHWVTVADCYRLMADRLQGSVHSGYYSILFEQNHSVYLVDNSTFDDETNRLLFTKIACISPPPAQTIIKDSYQFAEYAQQPYIGYKLADDVFYPVMKSEYLVLQLPDLLQRWHKAQS